MKLGPIDIELELELVKKSKVELVRESSLDFDVLLSVESFESRLSFFVGFSVWPLLSFPFTFFPTRQKRNIYTYFPYILN